MSRSATPRSSTARSATRRPMRARRRDAGTSWAPSFYGSGVMHVTGDRTDEAWPRHRRRSMTRASPPSPSTSSATGSSWATSSIGRAAGRRLARPLERLRLRRLPAPHSRSSGWRTCRSSPRLVRDRRRMSSSQGWIAASTSSGTRAGRSTCSGTTSSSPVSGSSGSRRVGSPAELRDVAYQATTTEFWGAMEAVGGRSTPSSSAARSTAARANRDRPLPVSHGCSVGAGAQRQRAQRAAPRRDDERHRRGLLAPAHEVVETALAASVRCRLCGAGGGLERRGAAVREQHHHDQRGAALAERDRGQHRGGRRRARPRARRRARDSSTSRTWCARRRPLPPLPRQPRMPRRCSRAPRTERSAMLPPRRTCRSSRRS